MLSPVEQPPEENSVPVVRRTANPIRLSTFRMGTPFPSNSEGCVVFRVPRQGRLLYGPLAAPARLGQGQTAKVGLRGIALDNTMGGPCFRQRYIAQVTQGSAALFWGTADTKTDQL